MLGLLLLYFIWKYYSELAVDYGRSKWYGLLGIVSYYGGSFLGGFAVGFIGMMNDDGFMDGTSDIALGLMGIPFGIAFVVGLYFILKRNWKKAEQLPTGDTLDADLMDPNNKGL
jgi:hypothetical protein